MKTSLSHKFGANRKETARKNRKHDANFSQSRDIREDRGSRQQKFIHQPQTTLTHSAHNTLALKERPQLLLRAGAAAAKRPVFVKLNHPNARTVTVAGTFNGWHPELTPLRRVRQDEWVAELALAEGVYEYRFVVDGQWVDDPDARQFVPNGFGSRNSLLEIS